LAILIAPVELTPDKSRLPLPKHLTDRIEWLAHEKADTDAWLLAIDEGRFRLLSTEEVAANAHLDTLRQLVVEGKLDARNEPTFVLPPENASMPARLMQVSLRTHSSGWRMSMATISLAIDHELHFDCRDVLQEAIPELWEKRFLQIATLIRSIFPVLLDLLV